MSDEIILETRGLTKEFKGFVAVKDVSLKVRRGSIHALIGPNGAGKTTCFNLLTHFLEPTRGQIFFKGREITGSAPGTHRAHGPGALVPDLGGFPAPHGARERARGAAAQARRFFRFLEIGEDAESPRRAGARADRAVGLAEFEDTVAVELPYGRKRALEIATTLALDPEMMLLDEPTAGMAHGTSSASPRSSSACPPNRTVLMVEHNLSVVSTLSDKITVLQRGEILAEGDYADVSKNPQVMERTWGRRHA